MKRIEGTNIWEAENGQFIVHKGNGFIMGDSIDLGKYDSIDNYEEQPYTAESRADFFESLDIEDLKLQSN